MPYTSPPLHSFPSRSELQQPLPFKSPHISSSIPHFSTSMRNLPLFLIKNSLAAKMIKKGIRSFCSSMGSTSTLNQRRNDSNLSCIAAPSPATSLADDSNITGSPTLEQMLVQLELEEAAARRANMNDYEELLHRRMSCVNNADILRTARNALNQHPRFSLDGRDSLYRLTFRNEGGRRPFRCSDFKGRHCIDGHEVDRLRDCGRPSTVGGENVMWCKPGVVARLMGLDAVPVPVRRSYHDRRSNTSRVSRQNHDFRRMERVELESKMVALGTRMHGRKGRTRMEHLSSCLTYDQC